MATKKDKVEKTVVDVQKEAVEKVISKINFTDDGKGEELISVLPKLMEQLNIAFEIEKTGNYDNGFSDGYLTAVDDMDIILCEGCQCCDGCDDCDGCDGCEGCEGCDGFDDDDECYGSDEIYEDD